jgi:hypothetical protein
MSSDKEFRFLERHEVAATVAGHTDVGDAEGR